MGKKYRNSDFKNDTFYKKPQFYERLRIARLAGKETYFNEVRKINNSKDGRKYIGDISIQDIFLDNWESFLNKYDTPNNPIRKSIKKNVADMINCQNPKNGVFVFRCPNCNNTQIVTKTCKSRFCPKCGKKYRDKIAISVSKKILKMSHRQLVFTIPPELRPLFRLDRRLLGELFASVNESLIFMFKRHAPKAYKKEGRRLGFICFLHTYGRDLKWHPHIHVLYAENYITKDGIIHKSDYLHFDALRKVFLFTITNKIVNFFKQNEDNKVSLKQIKALCEAVKKRCAKGSYFYGPKQEGQTSIKSVKAMANYIARYASHPAISERRLTRYDKIEKKIYWYYDPHEDDTATNEEDKLGRQEIVDNVDDFIKKLIIHIPEKGFQQIRYYGFYSNASYQKYICGSKLFTSKDIDELILRNTYKHGILWAFGYNPLLCQCGYEMVFAYEASYYGGPT